MSEKEYKAKCETMFERNTVLLNQQKTDAEQIRDLHKQNGELTDKVKELEVKIEKMKSDVELARDNANETEDWETFSVLTYILDDWEKKESD